MNKEEKLHTTNSESSVNEADKNVTFPDMENLDFNLHDTEEVDHRDVSNFVEVEASPTTVAEKTCNPSVEVQKTADVISHMMEYSREGALSDINRQNGTTSSHENTENKPSTTIVTDERGSRQQVLEANSNLCQESSNINIDTLITNIKSKTEESSDISHVTDVLDQGNILSNEKEKNVNANIVIDKSQLPPDVVKVLKNMLDNKLLAVPSDKTQTPKPKIIVAKVSTNALKQMIASNDGRQMNNIENFSSKSNSTLPPNLAKVLKNVIVQKASSQLKGSSITKYKQLHLTKVPSSTPSVFNETFKERKTAYASYQQNSHKFEVFKPSTKTAVNESYQHLRCPYELCVSKYLFDRKERTREIEYLLENCDLDFAELILQSSKKALLLTLPYSPSFEDEKFTYMQIIAEESGTMSSFEFTDCIMEKEFNLMFHHFSCAYLSDTTPKRTVLEYIFQTMSNLVRHFSVQEALKLTCNCSLCWFLYIRGKIFNTYYPEESLTYAHSPLASFRTVAVRNIEIMDLNPKLDNQCSLQEKHNFLPIRFKRGGKKRDLTETTALCDSFNPHLNGEVYIKRSKEAEINEELSKYFASSSVCENDDYIYNQELTKPYSLSSTYVDDEYSYINNDKIFSSESEIVTPVSIETVSSVKQTADNEVTSTFTPSIPTCNPSLNNCDQNDKNGINSESSVTFTEISDEISNLKPMVVDLTDSNLVCKSMFTLKSYGPATRKSLQHSKRTNIPSTSISSQMLSMENENNLEISTLLNSPVSIDLSEVNPLDGTFTDSDLMNTKSDFLSSENSDHYNKLNDGLMTTATCPQSKPSQKQMPIALSSESDISGSSNKMDCTTNPDKDDGDIIKNDRTKKSNIQISNQLEEQNCPQSMSYSTVVPESDVTCRLDSPDVSDSSNINNKTKTSLIQDISFVTESSSSSFKHNSDSLASSDLPSNNSKKQTEKSHIQETKEFHKFASSVEELSFTGVEHELESVVPTDSASRKPKKQIEIPHIHETKKASSTTEIADSGIEHTLESSASSDSTSSKLKEQIETANIQKSKECLISSSSVTELPYSGIKRKLEMPVTSDSTSDKCKKQINMPHIQKSDTCLKSVSSLREAISLDSGIKQKSDFSASVDSTLDKIKKQTKISHIEVSMPNSGIKHKLEMPVTSDSTSDKCKKQINMLHIQESDTCLKSVSSLRESISSDSGIKQKSDFFASVDPTLDKIKKQTKISHTEVSMSNSGIKHKLEMPVTSDSTSDKCKKQINMLHIQESDTCLKSVSSLRESVSSNSGIKQKSDFSVSVDPTLDKFEKQTKISHIEVSKEPMKPVAPVTKSPTNRVKCKSDSSVSKTKKRTQEGMIHDHESKRSKKSSEKAPESVKTYSPTSSGIKIVKVSGSNLFGTLQNFGISGAVNVVNLPSDSVSGVLKTLGVSNPAPTVSVVKLPRSCLPNSLRSLPTSSPSSSALNTIHVSTNASAVQLPTLVAAPLPTLQFQNASSGIIKVLQVPNANASVVQLGNLIGPFNVQSPYSGVVNIQAPNTNPNVIHVGNLIGPLNLNVQGPSTNTEVVQHPSSSLSDSLQVSNANSDAVNAVDNSSAKPSSQKAPENSNSATPVKVTENSKKIADGIQRRKQVFSVNTYSDGTTIIGGFRGFSE